MPAVVVDTKGRCPRRAPNGSIFATNRSAPGPIRTADLAFRKRPRHRASQRTRRKECGQFGPNSAGGPITGPITSFRRSFRAARSAAGAVGDVARAPGIPTGQRIGWDDMRASICDTSDLTLIRRRHRCSPLLKLSRDKGLQIPSWSQQRPATASSEGVCYRERYRSERRRATRAKEKAQARPTPTDRPVLAIIPACDAFMLYRPLKKSSNLKDMAMLLRRRRYHVPHCHSLRRRPLCSSRPFHIGHRSVSRTGRSFLFRIQCSPYW